MNNPDPICSCLRFADILHNSKMEETLLTQGEIPWIVVVRAASTCLCFSEIFLLTKFITLSVIVSPILTLMPLWKSQFDDALQPLLQTGWKVCVCRFLVHAENDMNKTALWNAEHDDDNYWNLIEADSEECSDVRGMCNGHWTVCLT